jgi:hypothetical protein
MRNPTPSAPERWGRPTAARCEGLRQFRMRPEDGLLAIPIHDRHWLECEDVERKEEISHSLRLAFRRNSEKVGFCLLGRIPHNLWGYTVTFSLARLSAIGVSLSRP